MFSAHFLLLLAALPIFSGIAEGQAKTSGRVASKPAPALQDLVLQGKIPEAARLASKSVAQAEDAVRKLLDLVDLQVTERQIAKAQATLQATESFVNACAKSGAAKNLSVVPIKGRKLRLQGIQLNDDKQFEKAEVILRQALDICKQIKDVRLEGGVHNNLGIALQFQEKLEEAAKEFESARQIAESQKDALRAGSYNFNLGKTLYQLGRHEQALQAFKRSAEQNKSASKTEMEARAIMMCGMAHSKFDVVNPEALRYFEQALKLFEQLGDKRNAGWVYYLMGDHVAYSQKFADGVAYGEKAVPLLAAAGDSAGLIPCYEFLSDMYARIGVKEKSEHYKKLAEDLGRKTPEPKTSRKN
jgi:tetratricopeptide (TPR) repeat protein